ncbi:hypothetical protein SPRG_05249 [Saprolegnia parasitica CBS 223.65]|uniref:Pre-mRNA-splicing factor Syf1/CRNKL1-like C-terminal HAT-repeats domain-containing protein n=1 Tax=Saprolegnia parasitica (strain CBS 223.65) TaxID=695850 RepID=A0A067CHQ9_SAPPC|nr:hypothetical protein SPRG_05249 [Saprolegnia parasitica CBS 223.65]KDO30058.1 hypothetical protein SPRG_05249 [Saprolegnia parasitica CBS 223.65]|eukprot:XP_012199239.1 hypothetical protein SPRG_05249 [Saprolegnia parasitica CBS 223.65]
MLAFHRRVLRPQTLRLSGATVLRSQSLVLATWKQTHRVSSIKTMYQQQRWLSQSRPAFSSAAPPATGSYFGSYSEETGEWEPERDHLEGFQSDHVAANEMTLQALIRLDINGARRLFRNVLQHHYYHDMEMWNKWATMEWRDGKVMLARKIFTKASKICFSASLWQSWATMEGDIENFNEARRLFNVIIAADAGKTTQTAMAGLGLALVEDRSGNTDKARKLFIAYKKKFPDDIHLAEAYALFEGRHGHMKLARQLFTQATQMALCTPQVFHAWAQLEYERGFYGEAVVVLDQGLESAPYDKKQFMLRAMSLAKLGDVDGARDAFREYTKLSSIDERAYNAFAQFEDGLGNHGAALKIYHTVLKHNPGSISNITSLAYLHLRTDAQHGLDDARETFSTGVAMVPDSAQLWHNWGILEEKHGDVDRAKEYYEKATHLSPWSASYWCSLAKMEAKRGNIESARVVLDLATQQCSNRVMLLTTLAKIERRAKNTKRARDACTAALKVDKKRAATWNLRALVEMPHHPEKAKNLIESALKLIPTHDHMSWSILLCTYGRAHAALGDYQNAMIAFKESIRLHERNPATYEYLAEFLVQIGHVDEAIKQLRLLTLICPAERVASVEARLRELEPPAAAESAEA